MPSAYQILFISVLNTGFWTIAIPFAIGLFLGIPPWLVGATVALVMASALFRPIAALVGLFTLFSVGTALLDGLHFGAVAASDPREAQLLILLPTLPIALVLVAPASRISPPFSLALTGAVILWFASARVLSP